MPQTNPLWIQIPKKTAASLKAANPDPVPYLKIPRHAYRRNCRNP